MNKEALEQEAEEYSYKLYHSKDWNPKEDMIAKAYLAGAEPRERQIERMKCPQNCKNGSVYNWSDNSICMDCEKVRTLHEDNWQEMCKGCKYWEGR